MSRRWKSHDLVDLFNSIERGYLPIPAPISTIEHWTDNLCFKLDPAYEHSGMTQPDQDMEFKIDTNVPAPDRHRGVDMSELTKAIRASLEKLTPGDSFFIPKEAGPVTSVQGRLASGMTKLKPRLFTQRKQYFCNEFTGIRVWRLE